MEMGQGSIPTTTQKRVLVLRGHLHDFDPQPQAISCTRNAGGIHSVHHQLRITLRQTRRVWAVGVIIEALANQEWIASHWTSSIDSLDPFPIPWA